MTDKLIREETKQYYRCDDGAVFMKICERVLQKINEDGTELWGTTTSTIPLDESNMSLPVDGSFTYTGGRLQGH